jgi:sodium/potassium/calcium exchanger 6
LRYFPAGDGAMNLAFATPIALFGFIMAATWIDYIADHLVSLLDFLGIICNIPSSIMGLTVLAWGNSMGDLSANMTMARKGLANMAMTACFAGPVFNILIGLALGFSTLSAETGESDKAVVLNPSIITGFVAIIIHTISLIVIGTFVFKARIPKGYGYFAIGLYMTYVTISFLLQFGSTHNN